MDLQEVYRRYGKPDPRQSTYVYRKIIWQKEEAEVLLEVLWPNSLYIVANDTMVQQKKLKEGEILVSNLELTRRNGYDVNDQEQINFMRYKNIYEVMRGLGVIQKRYDTFEIPLNQMWRDGLHELLLLTVNWQKIEEQDDPIADTFALLRDSLIRRDLFLRNEEKIKARQQTQSLEANDSLGRFNPHRLPLKIFSAQDVLSRRKDSTRKIAVKVDLRVMVLADYLDVVFQIRDQVELQVKKFLTMKKKKKNSLVQKQQMISQILELSAILQNVHLRPFGPWSYRHSADDLAEAVIFLKTGDREAVDFFLQRVQYSMRLINCRRSLERVLFLLSRAKKLKMVFSERSWQQAVKVFLVVRIELNKISEKTYFRNEKILPLMRQNLHAAIRESHANYSLEGKKEKEVYKALKKACTIV